MYIHHSVLWLLSLLLPVAQQQQHGTPLPLPASNQVCLIVPQEVEQCYRGFQGKPIDDKAAQVNCLQKLLWNFTPDINNTQSELDFFRSLAGDIGAFATSSVLRNGNPRPPSGRRARQEYRTLTPSERQRFHDALNKLYEDGTIRAFSRLHARAFTLHHNGASFLPWHRVFLVMFEEALRRIDPTVSLPFWDSTVDNDMDNPVNSALWTAEYFGNGVGDVTSGPAAFWVTDQGNLERNYGQASRLLSKDQIRKVLSKCELQQIAQPTAETAYDFELYQGGPHVWIGGDMASGSTTGFDPVFYMHHAFVDYVWELFRRRQYRLCGIDPTTDYPNISAGNSHAPESPMTGFEWLTNSDGLKHYWIDNWYYYESTPACPNCCRGCRFPAPIYCDRRRRVCTARSRRNFAFGPRDPNTSRSQAFSQASLDPAEIEAINSPVPPRNRGVLFQHPPSDGRTIHTAISDAFAFAALEEQAAREPPRQTTGPDTKSSTADSRVQSRGSERPGPAAGRGTSMSEGLGPSADTRPREDSRGSTRGSRSDRVPGTETRGTDRTTFQDGGRIGSLRESPRDILPEVGSRGGGSFSIESGSRSGSTVTELARSAVTDGSRGTFPVEQSRGTFSDVGFSSDSAIGTFPDGSRIAVPAEISRGSFTDGSRVSFPAETPRGSFTDGSRAAFPAEGPRGSFTDSSSRVDFPAETPRGLFSDGSRVAFPAEPPRGPFIDGGLVAFPAETSRGSFTDSSRVAFPAETSRGSFTDGSRGTFTAEGSRGTFRDGGSRDGFAAESSRGSLPEVSRGIHVDAFPDGSGGSFSPEPIRGTFIERARGTFPGEAMRGSFVDGGLGASRDMTSARDARRESQVGGRLAPPSSPDMMSSTDTRRLAPDLRAFTERRGTSVLDMRGIKIPGTSSIRRTFSATT